MKHRCIKLLCLIFSWLAFATTSLQAQKLYGYEWIRPYMPYLKIKLIEKGIYRLDSTSLQNSGFSLVGLNPNRLQLFRNGVEVRLYLQGAADNVFNQNDFLAFYGEPNDGKLDAEMYVSATEQPHTFRSQYDDTAVYFLTYLPDTSTTTPLRYTNYVASDYNAYVPESQFKARDFWAPMEDYYYGSFIPASNKYYLSDYGDAEGMMSYLLGLGQTRTQNFATPYWLTGQSAQVEIKVIGSSDFFLADPVAPNHHLRIYAIAANNQEQLISDTTFRGYGPRLIRKSVPASLAGNSLRFRFEVVNDLSVGTDYIGISYIDLSYTKAPEWLGEFASITLNNGINAAKTLLQFSGYTGNTPVVWDASHGLRSEGIKVSGNAQILLPYQSGARTFYLQESSNYLSPASLEKVAMQTFSPSNKSFLIVSHPLLSDAATAYAAYRSQKFQTLLAYSPDLYNYYTYGYEHPLAVRRFAAHFYDKQSQKPGYLLLLGRGYQNNLIRSNPANYKANLVPSIGVPSSENLFTNGFVGNDGAPAIATGRIPAATNQEARNYLDKLINYETRTDSIALWRKNYLHLSGGENSGQQASFRNHLRSIGNEVLKAPVGAKVFAYYKSTTEPTENKLKETLIGLQNNGLNLLTFYGHGSLTVLDMDFGGIQDLSNTNKPSFYYFNGCNIGNANEVDPLGTGLVYGKDFICAPNKGAIGWLAHSNLTFTSYLEQQMRLFYEQLSGAGYGKSVGENLKSILQQSSAGNEPFARSHALQLLLQADPALVLYAPALPDYKIASNDLFVNPSNATIQDDSLAIGIIVSNLAKASTTDTLNISLERTLPNNQTINYTPIQVMATLHQDTFYFWVRDLKSEEIGNNVFKININPSQSLAEISYQNNSASFTYFLPGSGVRATMPPNFAIVNMDTVLLLGQNNNLFAPETEYVFELDTSAKFNSTGIFHLSSGIIKAKNLVEWRVTLPSGDSLTWFWRVKQNLPEAEGGIWSGASFTKINATVEGWHQSKYAQLKQASASRFIVFDDSLQQLSFSNNELVLGMENRRWDHRNMGVTTPYLLNEGVFNCMSQGTVVLVFEPFQVDWPYELPNYPFNCTYIQNNKNRQSNRYYTFNTNTSEGEQALRTFIDSIPTGYMVAAFSRYQSNIHLWESSTKNAFGFIGAQKVQQIGSNNTAWAVIGRKGDAPGTAEEDTVYNDGIYPVLPPRPEDPQDNLKLAIRKNFVLRWFEGDFTTAPVGPALSYSKVKVSLVETEANGNGRWWYDVIGVNSQGKDTLFFASLNQTEFSIQNIQAALYPFVKLKFHFVDSVNRTPHKIKYAQVVYEPAAELTFGVNENYVFNHPQLAQGDTLRMGLYALNISPKNVDSVYLKVLSTDANRLVTYQGMLKLDAVAAGGKRRVAVNIPTRNLQGKQSISLQLNPDKTIVEQTYNNNFLQQDFEVLRDQQNPYLEVTFDGQRIFNGDIVSPSPFVKISATDKNPFLLQQDTSNFEVYLKVPGEFEFQRIFVGNGELSFIPASDANNRAVLEYRPNFKKDGVYTLKVNAKDASGNAAGANDYEIDFNVISKSTITHFYPYPNPFTTQTRFVFTLTGSEIPEQLLIRILTANGKVVREIRKDEFGPIRIGNNISEFAWDGTDMYGDRLANGVYLYQVFTQINGQSIEHRTTRAKDESKYFIQNTGKIYLLR
jgi:hypothetical protein